MIALISTRSDVPIGAPVAAASRGVRQARNPKSAPELQLRFE
jgi:hypothetical protein